MDRISQVTMKLTSRTLSVQGGTLVEYEGKLRLLEIAQVPKDYVSGFVRYLCILFVFEITLFVVFHSHIMFYLRF